MIGYFDDFPISDKPVLQYSAVICVVIELGQGIPMEIPNLVQ